MSWYGGFVLRGGSCRARIPSNARVIRDGSIGVWVVEGEPDEIVRIIRTNDLWVAVFGICAATDNDILGSLVNSPKSSSMWPGSYTLVVCNRQSIRISSDIANARPIYVADTHFGTVWSSSSRQLAMLTQSYIDPYWLATYLLAPGVECALAARSAFVGISTVPAGNWLVINTGRNAIDRDPMWMPSRRTNSEAAMKLAGALYDGIRARVKSNRKITADCSGGFDSTTLTLLALSQIDDPDRLTATTFHPIGVTAGGDFDYVNQLLAAQPKLVHRWIGLDDSHLPFGDMCKVPASDEPAPMTAAYARMVKQFRLLSDAGSRIHLTGDGGDTLFCPPLLYLADLMDSRRYIVAYRHAIGWARVRRASPWRLLRDAFVATRRSYLESIASLATSLQQRTTSSAAADELEKPSASWNEVTNWPWITDLACQNAAQMLHVAADSTFRTDLDRAGLLTLDALRTVGRTARADIQVATSHGVLLDNPYLDSNVVDAVLSVPAREWASPEKFKPLLTQTFPNLLPKAIMERTTKGSFEIDHYRGAHVHAALLHDLVDGELAALGLVKATPLHNAISLATIGLPINLVGIERALVAEVWLRAVKAAPNIPWRAHQSTKNHDASSLP